MCTAPPDFRLGNYRLACTRNIFECTVQNASAMQCQKRQPWICLPVRAKTVLNKGIKTFQVNIAKSGFIVYVSGFARLFLSNLSYIDGYRVRWSYAAKNFCAVLGYRLFGCIFLWYAVYHFYQRHAYTHFVWSWKFARSWDFVLHGRCERKRSSFKHIQLFNVFARVPGTLANALNNFKGVHDLVEDPFGCMFLTMFVS